MADPQLSPGGNRAYTMEDIFSIMNQDISNTAAPDLTVDPTFTESTFMFEVATMNDSSAGGSFTAVAATEPTWGSGSWGFAAWN